MNEPMNTLNTRDLLEILFADPQGTLEALAQLRQEAQHQQRRPFPAEIVMHPDRLAPFQLFGVPVRFDSTLQPGTITLAWPSCSCPESWKLLGPYASAFRVTLRGPWHAGSCNLYQVDP